MINKIKTILYYRDLTLLILVISCVLSPRLVMAAGDGLQAQYWNYSVPTNNYQFPTSSADLTRIDSVIDNDWGSTSPAGSIDTNNFAARWQGSVEITEAGSYIFNTQSDDGVRLWVNDQLVINNWTNHGATWNNSQAITLVANTKYTIQMEFFESTGLGVARLHWQTPSNATRHVIPQSQLYSTVTPQLLSISTASACSISNELVLRFNTQMKTGIADDSAEKYQNYTLSPASPSGLTVISAVAVANDPSTIKLSLNKPLDANTNYTLTVSNIISAKGIALRANTGAIDFSASSMGNGLQAYYWNFNVVGNDYNFPNTTPDLTRIDDSVAINWGSGSPNSAINPDDFAVRWEGFIEAPETGDYVFSTYSDDGIRLWIDNKLVINNWRLHSTTLDNSPVISLIAGQRYQIKMEFFEHTGQAVAGLLWKTPSGSANQIIPTTALFTCAGANLTRIAHYHFDERSWQGAQDEVIDSSGNAYHGTAINGAQTDSLDPAIPNTPGSCGFGQFDGINDYVALPDFPNLTGSFTITAWIKSDAQHYGRIFVDDDNNSGGYALSMSDDNHQGILRFYSRQVSPVSLDTTQVITDPNKWYFVTAVHDLATQQRFIYVNGVLKANDTYKGTWGTDSGTASISSETNASIEGVGFAPFHGNIDEVQVFQSALSVEQIRTIMAETQPCSIYTKVENFNCIVSGSDPFSGQLLTKLTDQNFTVDIAALENSTTLASHFSDTVTVELVDASQGNSCATYPVLNPEISHSLSFNVNDNAIKTSEPMSSRHAYRNLKCRVTDNMTTTPIVGCSGDSFAIRPQNFTITSPLNNTNNSGSPSSKTGTHFSITAASNSVNYDGIPAINASLITAHPGAIKIGILTGEFPAADPTTGTTTGTHFNYSEVGSLTIKNETIVDNGYTAVDQSGDCIANSSTNTENSDGKIGCNIANTPNNDIIIGRFIPDHFTLTSSAITPACNDFSYMDQLFGISYSLEARNSNNISTKNYNYSATSGQNYVKTTAVTITAEYVAPLATTSSNLTSRLSMLYDPTNWSEGRYVITHGNALFSRLNNTVDGAYDNLDIGLKVIDSDGVVLGSPDMLSSDNTNANCTASTCLENKLGQTDIRYGRLIIGNAHGSELLPLNLPFSTEFYTGLAWQVNTADSCTTVSTANNFTYTANGITLVPNLLPASASLRLSNGLSSLAFGIAGEDNTGNIDITGSLTALPWLQFDWNGDGSYDNNPLGRATFGIFKGNDKIIFRREVY